MTDPARRLHPLHVAVAKAMCMGRESQQHVAERIAITLDDGQPWMLLLADSWLRSRPRPHTVLAHELREHGPLNHWIETHPGARPRVQWRLPARRIPGLPALPTLATSGELAAWLGWSPQVLDGHCDARRWHRNQPAFRDYLYRWHGTRLIEAPKDRLKRAQRKILRQILDLVPLHDAAHGFVRERSVHSHAALHAGRPWVARVDLRCFFPTVGAARVDGLFRALGYPDPVARALCDLTTTWTPADVSTAWPWNHPHLPQGAPTSPALANAIAWTLDRRLDGRARTSGLTYSRYADDLTFSGARPERGFLTGVANIVRDEGFHVHPDKTRVRTQAQQQRVTGLVVNHLPAVPRKQRDRIRAILHRAETSGWQAVVVEESEDARAWTQGWIAWIRAAHPTQGERLYRRFLAT